jgi:hypothetical protein
MMDNSGGFMYLCDDGDIFILFQGALRPVTQKLSTHFGDIDPERYMEPNSYNIFRAFDLSKHWEEFYDLCEVKYYKKLLQEEAVRRRFEPPFHSAKGFAHKPA